jgi:hypothetical protein
MIKEENVFSRWSRRKLQTEKESLQEDAAIDLSTLDSGEENLTSDGLEATNDQNLNPDETDALLTDADMPDIETLNEGSDFSGFMSSGVSDELRNLALRKLFKAPGFNLRDGLDEYDEDYTSFEKLGDIITCDMKHQLEIEAEKLRQKEQETLANEEIEDITEAQVSTPDEPAEERSEDEDLLPDVTVNREGFEEEEAETSSDYKTQPTRGDRT